MFSTERSDYGSTIAGYLLSAVMLIFAALQEFNGQFNLFTESLGVPFRTLALFLVIAGAIAIWKAYITDGVTFMIIGLGAYAFVANVPMFLIALAIAALVTAFMTFRVGDMFALALNAVFAVAMILVAFTAKADFLADNPVIAGIVFLIGAGIAGYLCLSDWMLFQDIAKDYVDEMFGDEECCCDDDCCCDDEECDCHDGECHCHDEECQCDKEE